MSERIQGRIIKGIGGFYYVDTAQGIVECRARGSFRKAGITPVVGDIAEVRLEPDGRLCAVERILPRQNLLVRPPVANVTQMAVVVAAASPRPNLLTLDKLIAAAEHAGAGIILCLNKTDLDVGEALAAVYRQAGFPVIQLSAAEGWNIDELRRQLCGQVTVFAGNSGVGKSSLLNCLLGEKTFETGEVNEKIARGRHTTRHSELVVLPEGGYLIDTPGFSSFTLEGVPADELAGLFREFAPYRGCCRFRDCSHTVEKGCAVLEALEDGKIALSRHESYKTLYTEAKAQREW